MVLLTAMAHRAVAVDGAEAASMAWGWRRVDGAMAAMGCAASARVGEMEIPSRDALRRAGASLVVQPRRIASHRIANERSASRCAHNNTTKVRQERALTESRVPLNCSLEMLSSISSSFFLRAMVAVCAGVRVRASARRWGLLWVDEGVVLGGAWTGGREGRAGRQAGGWLGGALAKWAPVFWRLLLTCPARSLALARRLALPSPRSTGA